MKKILLFLMLIPALAFSQESKIININPDGWGGVINIDPGNSLDLLLDSVQNWIWVSKDNQTGTETGTMIYPYNTIQEGLDAATSGMVVIVLIPRDNSAYEEHLVMSTANVRLMTLEGQTVAVELQSVGAMGMDIDANGLIIGGGSGNGFTFTFDAGLGIVFDANRLDVEISYNDITPAAGSIAINVGANGSTRLKILNNTFHVNDADGAFFAVKNLIDVEIIGNEFIIDHGAASGYCIQMSGFYNGIIANNYIHADTSDATPTVSGIFPHTNTSDSHASDSLEIYGNIIQDCGNGIRLGHSNGSDMKAIFVYDNIIERCVDGVEIYNDAQVYPGTYYIYDNKFKDNINDINNAHATGYNAINILDGVLTTTGKIDADYAEAAAATNETRYYDFTVTNTTDPAGSAEVNSGYFAYNKTGGSNGVYTITGLEGVVRSSYADEAGTFRGILGRTYINADATSTMRTAIGGEFSARASYNGGTEAVAENGTAFVGSRIWMAPYFTSGSLSNINNFHGFWLYNEHSSNTVTNAIYVDDIGGTGGWTNGINFNGATIGTTEILGSQGETWENVTTDGIWTTDGYIAGIGVNVDSSIQFTPQSSVDYSEGLIYYDSDDKTLIVYNDESDVALNVGEEMYKRVRNNSGGLIADGTPVYISGAVGQLPTIAKTDADAAGTSLFVGLATHDIEDNSNGYITSYGIVRGLDTDGSPYGESWSDGDQIYISTTVGELTNIRPSGVFVVCVGHVDYAHTSQGRLQVHPKTDWAIDYRIEDSLKLDYMATATTTVVTPTATGKLDTLETADIATTDITVTGDWVFDNFTVDTIYFENAAEIHNGETDTLKLVETVVKVEGNLVVTGNLEVAGTESKYADMYLNANGNPTTMETANSPIGMIYFTTGDQNGFTFNAGGTGAITAYADYDGTVGGTVRASDASHGLATGDFIVIRGTTNYNGVFQITDIDGDSFYFTDGWVANDGASDWEEPSYLQLTSGANETFDLSWHLSAQKAGGAAAIVQWSVYKNTTLLNKTITERRIPGTDLGSVSGGGLTTSVSAGDRFFMVIKSDNTNDITNKYGTLILIQE